MYIRPKTVTHPSTNRARRALTSFMPHAASHYATPPTKSNRAQLLSCDVRSRQVPVIVSNFNYFYTRETDARDRDRYEHVLTCPLGVAAEPRDVLERAPAGGAQAGGPRRSCLQRRKSILDYFTLAARNSRPPRRCSGGRRRTTLPGTQGGDARLMGVVSQRYQSLSMLFAKYDSCQPPDRCR